MSEKVENLCGLKREDFQTTVNGKQTDLFILKNSQGNEVAVTNYGGASCIHAHFFDEIRKSENSVVLKYTSPYGEEGFTG